MTTTDRPAARLLALVLGLGALVAPTAAQQSDPFDTRANLFGRRPDLAPALGDPAPEVGVFRLASGSATRPAEPDAVLGRPSSGRPLVIAFGSYT